MATVTLPMSFVRCLSGTATLQIQYNDANNNATAVVITNNAAQPVRLMVFDPGTQNLLWDRTYPAPGATENLPPGRYHLTFDGQGEITGIPDYRFGF